MVEFIVKLGTLMAITFAILSLAMSIPAIAGLATYILPDYGNSADMQEGMIQGMNQLAAIMQQYVTPFIALINNVLPVNVKSALGALIVWKMTKPLAFRVLAPLEQALEKLITKA